MSTILSVALALSLSQMGTLKGHVYLTSPSAYKSYTVAIATRPTPATPGHMGNFVMRLVKRLSLDSKGNFSTTLAPGVYDVGLYKEQRRPVPTPHQQVTIQAGRTVAVKMYETPPRVEPKGL